MPFKKAAEFSRIAIATAVWTCSRIHKSTCYRGNNYATPSHADDRRMRASATDIADPYLSRGNVSPPPSFGETCRLMVAIRLCSMWFDVLGNTGQSCCAEYGQRRQADAPPPFCFRTYEQGFPRSCRAPPS